MDVFDRYESLDRYPQIGISKGGKIYGALPPTPTDAKPGSEEKIRVMESRAELGYSLFHPQDPKV